MFNVPGLDMAENNKQIKNKDTYRSSQALDLHFVLFIKPGVDSIIHIKS